MPTEVLSRRIAALETCRVLHLAGELDDKLLPIGKESFHLLLSSEELVLDEADQLQVSNDNDPRPGTNKRRQYYRRRVRFDSSEIFYPYFCPFVIIEGRKQFPDSEMLY